MNQEQFMMDYYPSNMTVTVNAVELQNVLKERDKAINALKALQYKLELTQAALDVAKSDIPIHVDLHC